jgi:cytochrome c biogenesis protein CcdA
MFGLDHRIATLGTGETLLIVMAVAVLLGLRHATDPDHLTAVSTLLAGERGGAGDRSAARRAGRLGLVWGAGHATTLFVFGLPIVLFGSYLPDPVQMAAEAAVGVLIVALAVRLLARWRRGELRPAHGHPHGPDGAPLPTRSPLAAYAIGLVHGMGGSAGVGVLLLAAIPDHVEGVAALAVFAACTAVSMTMASTSFGWVLQRGAVQRAYTAIAPALGVASLAFGVWYALGAVEAVPYVL